MAKTAPLVTIAYSVAEAFRAHGWNVLRSLDEGTTHRVVVESLNKQRAVKFLEKVRATHRPRFTYRIMMDRASVVPGKWIVEFALYPVPSRRK